MSSTASDPAALERQYVKFCDLHDFDDPRVLSRIGEVVPQVAGDARLHRKYWEYALLTLFLEDLGLLRDDVEVLSVGAGQEEVLFWLANRVGRVVAADIYGEGSFADREAEETMLTNPAALAPYPYPNERLEVVKMDARELAYPDVSFDVVFSLSSIEHFGGHADIRQAAREIGRVLRPGGYAFLVTEAFVGKHPLNSPWLQFAIRLATLGRRAASATPRKRVLEVFTVREIERLIIRPSGLGLVQELDEKISPETWTNLMRFTSAEELEPATGQPNPHILLVARGAAPWTSVALALRKPA